MFKLIPTNESAKHFGLSFSLLNFVNDYSSLMEYLFAKDIGNTYMEIGSKFHANMAGEYFKCRIDYFDYKDDDNKVYLSPHSVSNTYIMSYLLQNNNIYLDIVNGNVFKEYRKKAWLLYKGYKFLLRAVFDVINIDTKSIIELKTATFYKKTLIADRNYDMQAYIYSIIAQDLFVVNKIYIVFVQTIFPFKEFIREIMPSELESGYIKFKHKLDLLISIIELHNLHHLFFSNE